MFVGEGGDSGFRGGQSVGGGPVALCPSVGRRRSLGGTGQLGQLGVGQLGRRGDSLPPVVEVATAATAVEVGRGGKFACAARGGGRDLQDRTVGQQPTGREVALLGESV